MSSPAQIAEEISLIGPRIGRRITADLMHAADIPHAQLSVILMLFNHGPARACEIGKELRVAPPTATGIVDRLLACGYVKRSPDKEDRRVVVVELTAQGKKLGHRVRSVLIARWTRILSRISREDAEKYLEILKKINEAL